MPQETKMSTKHSLVLLGLFLISCDQLGSDEITAWEVEDEGQMCREDTEITIQFDFCMSSSCDTLLSATCETGHTNEGVVVTSHAAVESTGGVCSTDCQWVTATCDLPNEWTEDDTISHGDETTTIGAMAACENLLF